MNASVHSNVLRRCLTIAIGLIAASSLSCGEPPVQESGPLPEAQGVVSPDQLRDLFEAVVGGAAGTPSPSPGDTSRTDALWPVVTYLNGELHLRQGNPAAAKSNFSELVIWATGDAPRGPYGDTWGGSSLAAIGLWRWLQLLEQESGEMPDNEEVKRALAAATQLLKTRLYAGLVQPGLLPALPALEEDIAGRLARLAWRIRHPDALSLFLGYLALHSGAELEAIDRDLYEEVLKEGLATQDRLELFRARRILGLSWPRADKNLAANILWRLWEDSDVPPDVRAQAGYEWAHFRRQQPDRRALIKVLTQVIALTSDPSLIERALYARGRVHNRGSQRRDTEAFRADMTDLLERFPTGRLADDAINQLASEYFHSRDLDLAVAQYRRLQDFPSPHDYQDSAYYVPSLILFAENNGSGLDDADQMLEKYIERYPDGIFRVRAVFWRGRIAERRGDAAMARALFSQVLDEAPYDYYGIRARLHLEYGADAVNFSLPVSGSQTRSDLHEQYLRSHADRMLTPHSPYHDRVKTLVATGIYRRLLELAQRSRVRIDNQRMDELDADGRIPEAVLLLATRQDALAARDLDANADNMLELSGFVGQEAHDWTLALGMIQPRGTESNAQLKALQKDVRYLASAYPHVSSLGLLPLLEANAWPIDGSRALSASLMYSVMRQESQFYAKAISQAGALGLFQFMPRTFQGLGGTQLLESSGISSDIDYLLDPARNIGLWARWIQDEHRLTARGDIAPSLMNHQAGGGNVRRWRAFWLEIGTDDDLEYKIETARFPETRNFMRWSLRDLAIVDASGMFGESSPQTQLEANTH